MYVIEKTLDDNYSCAFRQPTAIGTHCDKLHGYSLSFKIRIECDTLDDRNWVFSFGDFKALKDYLKANFDHKTAIAAHDPQLEYFKQGHELGVLDLNVLPRVGCECFAEQVFVWFNEWLMQQGFIKFGFGNLNRSVVLKHVLVYERDSNMGGFFDPFPYK